MAIAQSDPFGQLDRVYVDSVVATPGQQIPVKFMLANDELVSGCYIPITYDTNLVKLTSVSFAGSRGEYIQTKIVTPDNVSQAGGHFLVAIIKFGESPIPAGDGLMFTANFTVNPNAPIGSIARIDTLFYAPGGYFMLTENATASGIRPAFKAGKIMIRLPNRAPALQSIPTQYVMEGDTLKLNISATDPDNDSLSLAAPTKPSSATFTSQGGGKATLTWVPDYVGPLSADGSPFTVVLWASDGKVSSEQQVQIQVVNRNRRPSITAPGSVQITAGDSLKIAVSATDPDFESVTWKIQGNPVSSHFDSSNPAHLSWCSPVTDSGLMNLTFIASDPQGSADTANVQVRVQSAILYSLSIDTLSVPLGGTGDLGINLSNLLPVASFNLLVNYDQTVMSILSVSKVGTRADYFESYTYTLNAGGVPGNIRIVGLASLSGVPAAALAAGDGSVAKLHFTTTGDLAYSGQSLPVKFVFQDVATQNDNTMTTDGGVKIPRTDIQYSDGYIELESIGTIKIGDINLNGIAYEIGDAIYFTNFLVNPSRYPFSVLQYANSDINHDNLVATIADLVKLINILVNGSGSGKINGSVDYRATVTDGNDDQKTLITYESACPVGGLTVTINTTDQINLDQIEPGDPAMTVQASREGDVIRVALYSLQGASMSAGAQTALVVPGLKNYTIESLDLASADGEAMNVTRRSAGLLPAGFSLAQNYPNPFNPETRIEFSLPQSGNVNITIFDALGRTVKRLASGTLEAGPHSVVWNGTNEQGQTVSSGVYFYRMESGSFSCSRKMMLLK